LNTIEKCVVTDCTNLLLAHILDSLSLIHSTHANTHIHTEPGRFSGKECAFYMSRFSRRGILATSKNIL